MSTGNARNTLTAHPRKSARRERALARLRAAPVVDGHYHRVNQELTESHMKHPALRIALMRAQMICRKAGRALNRAIQYLVEAGLLPRDAERMARYFAGAAS